MKKFRVGKKSAILALTAIMALGGMSGISNAANRVHKTFELSFDSTGDTDVGKWRTKDDNSKVYVQVNYVKYSKNRVKGWVQGKKYKDSDTQNCNGGYYYDLNKKGAQWMTNYVHEENLGYARIKGSTSPGAANKVEGVWSPDSEN